MRPQLMRLTAALCVLFAPIALLAVPAQAQTPPTPVTVTVNATSSVGKIPLNDHGVNTRSAADFPADASVAPQLQAIGANALRYPGGIDADSFNWEVPANTSNFMQFMALAKSIGASLIITTNYLNPPPAASGVVTPGDPTEAANWVAYANLHGYGGQYWEIGNEEYGYGQFSDTSNPHNPVYYGNAVVACAKAMKAQDPSIKVGAVLVNPGRDEDNSTIDWNSNVLKQCGASIDFVILHYYPLETLLPTDAQLLSAPRPQIPVLVATTRALINKYCGANATHVQILITETNSVGSKGTKQVTGLVNSLFVADETQMWLENGIPNVDYWNLHGGIYLTPDPNHPNKVLTNGNGIGLIQDNFFDASVPDNNYGNYQYADGGLLSFTQWFGALPYSPYAEIHEPTQDTPFANYYGEQMVGLLGGPNDYMVSSAADQSQVSSHAVRNSNGNLSVMLINKDPITVYNAKVVVKGYANSWTVPSTIYFFGQPNFSGVVNSAPSSLSSSPGTGGSSFYQSLPPYSITTVVLNAVPSSPLLTATASPSAANIQAGVPTNFSVNITNTGTALPVGSIVNVQVSNLTGAVINSTPSLSQVVSPGGNNFSWTAPSANANGTYYVSANVTDPTGQTQYYSGSNLAVFQVTTDGQAPPDWLASSLPPSGTMIISTVSAPATMSVGTTASITVSYTNNGSSITDMCANLEGYLPNQGSSNDVSAPAVRGMNLLYGQTQNVTYLWTAPAGIGTYTIEGGAFNLNWYFNQWPWTIYQYNPIIAKIQVVAYSAPIITVAGTVDQPSLAPGATTTIRPTMTDAGGPLTNGTAFVEVHDSNGNIVATQNITGLNWNTNQTVAYPPFTWTAPSTTGNYTVWVGVKDPSGNPTYKYNSVATINVTPASMAISATATPSTAAPGTIVTINGAATDNGGALSNDIAEIDIYSSSWGAPIGGATYPGQAWNTGQTHTYSTTWTAPSTPGTYYVYMTVKDPSPSGSPNYGYIPVTTITVPQPVITVPNFGFETPGLGNAQYLYRPTGGSWTFATNSGIASNGSAFNNPAAPQGSQVAFVQQSGTMSQTVTSGSAGVWTVSVSAAQRTNSAQTVNVLLDGTKIGAVTPTSNPFATYTVTSPSSVSAGSHTLTFQGTTTADNTAFIDNVQVTSH